MAKKCVESLNAPKAIGPYSPALDTGTLVFISGQAGIDPLSQELKTGLKEQAEQTMNNIKTLIEACGLSMDHIIKTTIFLTNIEDFAKVNEVYKSFFNEPYPARSTVELSKLPKNAMVEIEAIAQR